MTAAILAAIAVFICIYAASGTMAEGIWSRRLRRVTGLGQTPGAGGADAPEPEFGSLAHQLSLAGIRVAPGMEVAAYRLLIAGGALAGIAAALAAGLPPLPALGGGVVGAFAAKMFVDSRLAALRRRMERELPSAFNRIAALMSLTSSPVELLKVSASSLILADPNSPLGRELADAAHRVATEGPAAWDALMARARGISPSLELLFYELKRFSEIGGAHFSNALRAAAASQAKLIDARERARGKGDAAISSLRTIAVVMVGLLTFLVVDPVYRPVVQSVPGQLLVAGAFVAMATGYWFISKMVEDVL